jgi:hypothetical protein
LKIRVPVPEEFTYAMGDATASVMCLGRGGVRFLGSHSKRKGGRIVRYYAVYEIEGGELHEVRGEGGNDEGQPAV